MKRIEKTTVQCLCNPNFNACHCEDCQTWSGGPEFGMHANDVMVDEGKEHVKYYRSSDWAQRSFCEECGTHLFFKFDDLGPDENKNDKYVVSVGLAKELEELKFTREIFVDQKPRYYNFMVAYVKERLCTGGNREE